MSVNNFRRHLDSCELIINFFILSVKERRRKIIVDRIVIAVRQWRGISLSGRLRPIRIVVRTLRLQMHGLHERSLRHWLRSDAGWWWLVLAGSRHMVMVVMVVVVVW